MPFASYAEAGFGSELLPILPPDAVISPDSKARENLETSRGKVPGRLTRNGWVGFASWTDYESSAQDYGRWGKWRAGLGLQGRKHPAIDIDVDDGGLANAIEAEALFALGLAPCRFGRGARRLLVYSGAGVKKRRLAFRLRRGPDVPAAGQPGDPARLSARRADDLLAEGRAEETVFAVEVLGDGQQYVAEGVHPKTGQPYYWRDAYSPVQVGASGLTEVTAEEIDQFLENVRWLLEEIYDAEVIEHTGGGAVHRNGAVIRTPDAPSFDAVEEILSKVPNDVSRKEWIDVCHMIWGAVGEDGYDLWCDWSAQWPDNDESKINAAWNSVGETHTGFRQLVNWAAEKGVIDRAAYDFEAVDVGDSDIEGPQEPAEIDNHENMIARYAWVESAKRAVDLRTGALLDQEQFEFRIPPKEVVVQGEPTTDADGNVSPGKKRKTVLSAWKVFKEAREKRKSYQHLTCRFGGPIEVVENLPDLEGRCLNTWRQPKLPRLPDAVTDADVAPWLKLGEHVIPVKQEREHAYDFLAFTAQRPEEKINHALVLGSKVEGMGKDTLLEPLRIAIGRRYVREIGLPQLIAPFNRWVVGCKLLVVQEMHNFERKATMNLLKPLVAAPPEALAVNLKGMQEFFVPNLLNMVIFTNEPDALAVQNGDRRYHITWNDGEPLPKERYDELWDWLRGGGAENAIRWLLQRDVSKFNAKGRAPETAAKDAMRKETRTPLQEWVEESIANQDFPFDRDLIIADDALRLTPEYAKFKGQLPSPQKLAKVLGKAGAVCLTEQIRIQGVDGTKRIWAVRRKEMYAGLDTEGVRALFLKQRAEAEEKTKAAF